MNKWKDEEELPFSSFENREPILAQRIVLFNSAGVRAKRKIESFFNISEGTQEMLLNLASVCRKEGFSNLAIRYMADLHSMELPRDFQVIFWFKIIFNYKNETLFA